MMKRIIIAGGMLFFAVSHLWSASCGPIVANPINLNYKFGLTEGDGKPWREAADPVIEMWGDDYYLFASKSSGYWRSHNLADWEYIAAPSIETINEYAPTVCTIDGYLYYMASDVNRIFRTATPADGTSWREVECRFKIGQHDPCLWQDEDKRVYLYWGCHDKDPICGVEVDVANGFSPIGAPVVLIDHNIDSYGWEVPGKNNDETFRNGWNEGPAMIKHDGKYYLQYAAPGTQFRTYGDGVYVGDSPLGPFRVMESNPFSFKPGGFIGGAGHGHTFRDRYGNLWHVATMKISERHTFERRLALFPVELDGKSQTMRAYTEWTDYPFVIPQQRFSPSRKSFLCGYRQLASKAVAKASSSTSGHGASYGADDIVETWWAAESGRKGEWLELDLGRQCRIEAVQPNFADDGVPLMRPAASPMVYAYHIEGSDDGITWTTFVDRSGNTEDDMPHELIMLDKTVKARYVRIVNDRDIEGRFSLFDLRLFGSDGKKVLDRKVKHTVLRNPDDRRRITVRWDAVPHAERYIVRWGIAGSGVLNNSAEVASDTELEAGWYNRDSDYDFEVRVY
ncbi:family 43 glycosylhydrolase [Muribaculum intestinale]|uniref:family 43 glycosylhydrolase n=1 Tax=Muribaculum intestinale TaxID=1796646 RepID=UPI0025A9567C|nr:family 43 glycosylhydrolase [Muribaculum intestinale]